MKVRAAFLSLCLLALTQLNAFSRSPTPSPSPTPTPAKTEEQKELEKRVVEMIDQAVSDAATLRVAQNRAVVCALAGDLLWQFNEKRARELFRNSINELVTANIESDKEKKESEDLYAGLFEINSGPRGEILPLIAKHDADLALEGLVQTRPAKLVEAMAKAAAAPAKQRSTLEFNPDTFRIQNEISLEQKFAVLAAEQNPDKAIKLIKDSLAKGISWNVLSLLEKVHTKEPKKAASLADDVVSKIEDRDLSNSTEDLRAVIGFLQRATNPNTPKASDKKKFAFTDPQLKKIANKLVATFLQGQSTSLQMSSMLMMVIDDLEKLVPERGPLLRQKHADSMKALPPEFQQIQQQQKVWNPNSTPEEILAEMPKLNEFSRTAASQALVRKISEIEDEVRAKKLIDQIPDEKSREQAREAYESARISRASEAGKLDEAKKYISNLTKKKTQVQKLVDLAIQFHKKGTDKDKETALGLMKDAKALVNDYPEDEDELNDLMEIVRGYAIVSPNDSFRLFEPVVDQINDFLQASAILSKYNKRNRAFKKGELLLRVSAYSWDGQLLFRYIRQMEMLGKADLHRMSLITDKFQRSDARTIAKLFVVQGFLKEDKGSENDANTYPGSMVIEGDW